MKRTDNFQVNTRRYWNTIYKSKAKEIGYWSDNGRFPSLLEEIKDGDRFIDLGCSVGKPGKMVKEQREGCEIWGTDISDEIIEKNKERDPDITYFQGYIGYQDFLPDSYFDVAFCGEVIEHLDDPNVLFTEAYRILKKGGKLVISTPRESAILSPEHVWEYTEDDVRNLFTEAKFKNVTFKQLRNMEHLSVIFAVGEK